MSPANRQRLRTPQGTESFFMEEAYRHHQLLRMTEDHFASWGYLPVLTPVFDYYETYRPLLTREQEERCYRFPDRDGELLMLRSDITLFLAKQMGLTLSGAKLPRRVYYADSILRHEEEEDISNDEYFQAGAELIGLSGTDGDLEILMLLHDLLDTMQLPLWRMHIGSRAVLDAVLDGKTDPERTGELMNLRDAEALTRLLKNAGLPAAEARSRLLLFLGTVDEFIQQKDVLAAECFAQATGKNNRINTAVDELASLTHQLTQCAPKDRVRIDLSEHGGQPYYSGFTVRAYVEGANTAIASGGRYDELLGAFGTPGAAAGFSLMMRKIEPLSSYGTDSSELTDETHTVFSDGPNFVERYRAAALKREEGVCVVLGQDGKK